MTAAGRNDRSTKEFATVDWMAYQGAPDGGVAGKSHISQWWTGSQCKEVILPQAIIYFISIFWKYTSLRKQPTFGDATTGLPAK